MAGLIQKYRSYLPITSGTPIVTLEEGNTPLIPANGLAKSLGWNPETIFCKLEGSNPTGSFKDRGMTVAMSKALEGGARAVICASTGNTAASAAAYAARAGLPCFVFLPHREVAKGKISQSIAYGARLVEVKGNFDKCLEMALQAAQKFSLTIVNSLNPYRLPGQKTGAFEICEELGEAPRYHFIPVGNGGNITAYWMGYREWKAAGKIKSLPKMMGFQAKGAAPLVLGKRVAKPETIATAIRIGNPVYWKKALQAKEESGGAIDAVSDKEILEAYRMLARLDGIFCEPSSAAGVAGLIRYAKAKLIPPNAKTVCVLTGNGLKDPEAPMRFAKKFTVVKPDLKAVEKILVNDYFLSPPPAVAGGGDKKAV